MQFIEMQATARAVRAKYAQVESARYGRPWTAEEIMLGFLGDVGDLAKLVQGKAGVRPRNDLDDALAHELADCLWAVLTLADTYGVDLETAFADTMHAHARQLDGVTDTPYRQPPTRRRAHGLRVDGRIEACTCDDGGRPRTTDRRAPGVTVSLRPVRRPAMALDHPVPPGPIHPDPRTALPNGAAS